MTSPPTKDYVEVYRDSGWYWRWRRIAKRGNFPDLIIADGSEGYSSPWNAKRAAIRVNPSIPIQRVKYARKNKPGRDRR